MAYLRTVRLRTTTTMPVDSGLNDSLSEAQAWNSSQLIDELAIVDEHVSTGISRKLRLTADALIFVVTLAATIGLLFMRRSKFAVVAQTNRQGSLSIVRSMDSSHAALQAATQEIDLFEACSAGDVETVRFLLEMGVSPNASVHGTTPLMGAAGRSPELIRLCKLLIWYGADVNAARESDGVTALHKSAEAGNLETFKLLVKHNAQMKSDHKRHCPMMTAAINGHVSLVHYCEQNIEMCYPYERAASVIMLGAARLLGGADTKEVQRYWNKATEIFAPTGQHIEPMWSWGLFAFINKNLTLYNMAELCKQFLRSTDARKLALVMSESNSDSYLRGHLERVRAYQRAASSPSRFQDIPDFLVEVASSRPELKPSVILGTLHVLVNHFDAMSSEELLSSWCWAENRLHSAMYLAGLFTTLTAGPVEWALFGKVVRQLGKMSDSYERTTLHIACSRHRTWPYLPEWVCGPSPIVDDFDDAVGMKVAAKLVAVLLHVGVDACAKDKFGTTPLHTALQNVSIDTKVVHLLLSAGAHLDARDEDGIRPIDLIRTKSVPGCETYESQLISLKCIAARAVKNHKVPYQRDDVTGPLLRFLELH